MCVGAKVKSEKKQEGWVLAGGEPTREEGRKKNIKGERNRGERKGGKKKETNVEKNDNGERGNKMKSRERGRV